MTGGAYKIGLYVVVPTRTFISVRCCRIKNLLMSLFTGYSAKDTYDHIRFLIAVWTGESSRKMGKRMMIQFFFLLGYTTLKLIFPCGFLPSLRICKIRKTGRWSALVSSYNHEESTQTFLECFFRRVSTSVCLISRWPQSYYVHRAFQYAVLDDSFLRDTAKPIFFPSCPVYERHRNITALQRNSSIFHVIYEFFWTDSCFSDIPIY